jgi:transposase
MTDNKIWHRYQVILLYEQGLISPNQAAKSLDISERQFFRILNKFRDSGRKIDSLKYRSHPAWHRTPLKIEEKVVKMAELYPQALNSHLEYLLYDLEGMKIPYWNIRNILIRNGKYVPFKEKKDRAYKKFGASHFGGLVYLDASDGYWLKGYSLLHLILSVDDATRTILEGGFYGADSTLNNMLVIRRTIEKYGIPALYYTDCDSKFRVIRHGKSRYHTYQKEVKHHRANNLKELNQAFRKWVAWYDSRKHRSLGVAPRLTRERLIKEGKVAFRKVPKGLDIETIFSVQDFRKPNKCNIFSYQGKEYQLPLDKVVYPGKVELRIMPDNRIRVFNKEKELIAELRG